MRPSSTTKALTSPIFLALLALAVLGSVPEAEAQTEARQAWRAGGSVFLVPTAHGAEVELESGTRLRIPVPAGGEVSSLAAVSEGWLAAGTVLHEEGRRELRLWRGDDRQAQAWQPPPGQRAFLRDRPVWLTREGRLLGMAWLEGENPLGLAVMAAAWDGEGWGRPERVSTLGLASQLAPSGVVLADGSWLLAWSAVDGGDDEIVWARRHQGQWSSPRFASSDNRVPDVVPTLAATAQGALLAWSRYDGETYRVVLARFNGSTFVGERWVDELGSTDPRFVDGLDGPRLLYRVAPPRGWALLELDGRGRTRHRSWLETSSRESRPLVVDEPSGGLSLRFAGDGEARALVRQ